MLQKSLLVQGGKWVLEFKDHFKSICAYAQLKILYVLSTFSILKLQIHKYLPNRKTLDFQQS